MPGDVNIGGKLRSHREQYGGVLCKDRVDVRGTRWVHKLNQKHDKHQGSRIMSLPSKKCIHVSMQTACFHVGINEQRYLRRVCSEGISLVEVVEEVQMIR
jgi:hypothetical protein